MPVIWTLARIKEEIRTTTGRRAESQLSDAELVAYLNEYYNLTLPNDLELEEFHTFWTKDTEAGVDTVLLDANVLYLGPPFTIGGYPLEVTDDPNKFYASYPKNGEPYTQNRPDMALYQGRSMVLRPAPDTIYQIHCSGVVLPLGSGDFTAPLLDQWGRMIVLGTSILIYSSAGNREKVADLTPGYEYQKNLVQRPMLMKMQNYRGKARF